MYQLGRACTSTSTTKYAWHALSILWRTKLNGQPSNVLWIGYPPSVCVEEQMLHNAMMFGEVEIIRSFPSHDYSRVEFRSVDGAWRGKEGLQYRLLNDPRILIMYSISNVGCTKYSFDEPPHAFSDICLILIPKFDGRSKVEKTISCPGGVV
ncbi:hypothetical protein Vadar_023566 [Vaccinium darrowii]|uniref:Uncharacterized protein n=1 Tax=Vaccinium darrowii TaxID=229202 RepID=A0ACB7X3B7_9ERIC|nr:hypothetical protein Vadar_023566 [Vaccinium darrowii]